LKVVKHLINYGLYGMIYAIYGFLFNVGMESIIVRNDVKHEKYTREILKRYINLFNNILKLFFKIIVMGFVKEWQSN